MRKELRKEEDKAKELKNMDMDIKNVESMKEESKGEEMNLV